MSDHAVCLGSLPFPGSPWGPEQGALGRCGACTVTQGPQLGEWWPGLWMAPGPQVPCGRQLLGLPHTCSSSFLPPTPTLPPCTPVSHSVRPSLLDGLRGAVGLAGAQFHAGVLGPQPAPREPLPCAVRTPSAPVGNSQPHPHGSGCVHIQKTPLAVPASPSAHLLPPPPRPGASTLGLPCSQQPLGTAVKPRVTLLSCRRSPGSPGAEWGVDVYFLKFALHCEGLRIVGGCREENRVASVV